MFSSKIPENRRKSQKSTCVQRIFFWALSWISFEIHLSQFKIDGDQESVSFFNHSSIVEELLTNFWCTSGKFECSNCLKVKSELCSPHSFYKFKHSSSKEKVVYLRFISV
jgi:hypothetical protein